MAGKIRLSKSAPMKSDPQASPCGARDHADELAAARQSEQRLREAIDLLPEGIVFLDPDGCYILWNRKYEEIYSGSADLFKPGVRLADTLRIGVARGEYPDAVGREEEWLEERLTRLHKPGQRHEQVLADGRCILIEEQQISDGSLIGLRVDITEIKQQERSLRFLFEGNPLPMLVCARHSGAIVATNEAAEAAFRFDRERILQMAFQDLLAFGNAPPWRETSEVEHVSGREFRLVLADGELIDVAIYARRTTFQNRDCVVLALVDISDRVRAEAHIAHLRDHDALTLLPNRHAFEQDIAAQMAAKADDAHTLVICIDIDNLKSMIEAQGHAFGDAVIKRAAARLKSLVGERAMLARVGGRGFALAQTDAANPASAAAFASELLDGLHQPMTINGHPVALSASAGIAMTPRDGDNPQDLLKHADLALARAQEEGSGFVRFYEAEMDARAQARRRIETDLRFALENDILQPWYQPLVDLRSGRVAGFEALVRWPHPDRGFISPAEFIPIAEETGQIAALSERVLRQACIDAQAWPQPLRVAVNLSPVQFRSGTLLAVVMDALRRSGLAAGRLELEITETLLMDKSESVVATLHALRALGVQISLDDFGTGFSSLSYLRSFPFDKIKIDRSFVSNVVDDPGQQTIVKAVIGIGQGLGMQVTAEGIESVPERDWLASEGCDQGQGFLFSRARPQSEVLTMLHPDFKMQVA